VTFTLEDGTGVTDSNAYCDITFVDDYLTDRARTSEWTAADAVKNAALIKAADYVEKRFSKYFIGKKLLSTQGLSFPRDGAYDRDGNKVEGIPSVLKRAVAEYAVRIARDGELLLDPAKPVDSTGAVTTTAEIKSVKEKVGPLEETTEYVNSSDSNTSKASYSKLVDAYLIPAIPAADMLLEPLLQRANTVVRW
jgi:hypothetical protein